MNPTAINAAIQAGKATAERVTDAVVRILTPMFDVGVMDEPLHVWNSSKLSTNVTSDASVASARHLSVRRPASRLALWRGAVDLCAPRMLSHYCARPPT